MRNGCNLYFFKMTTEPPTSKSFLQFAPTVSVKPVGAIWSSSKDRHRYDIASNGSYCWWFRNPVNSPVEGKVVYPIIYRILYIPGGWEWDFWTINSTIQSWIVQVWWTKLRRSLRRNTEPGLGGGDQSRYVGRGWGSSKSTVKRKTRFTKLFRYLKWRYSPI